MSPRVHDLVRASMVAVCLAAAACRPESDLDAGSHHDVVSNDTRGDHVSLDVVDAMDADAAVDMDVVVDDRSDVVFPPDLPALDRVVVDDGPREASVDSGPVGDGGLSPAAVPEHRVMCTGPATAPTVTAGSATAFVLRGRVVTPTGVLSPGEVLTTGGTIACVAASCASNGMYAGATVIETHGVIYPGLVDDHNHVAYDFLAPWDPPHLYGDHGQWQGESMHDGGPVVYNTFVDPYRQNVDAHFCAMAKYGELRALVAGTTSIQGSDDRRCVRTLVRNLENGSDFGGSDPVRTNVLGISTVTGTALTSLQTAIANGTVTAYVIHLSEGVDANALAEFGELESKSLLGPATVIVHGTALGTAELARVGAAHAKLVWSPRSNVILYGSTTNIPAALDAGITVALAPDWSPSGGPNLLSELRYARYVSQTAWGNRLDTHALFDMVTSHAADAISRGNAVGRLAVGLDADITVVPDRGCDAYDTLVDAPAADIEMVMVGGRPLYGDRALMDALPASLQANCEAMSACGVDKRICVSAGPAGADGTNQTLADITAEIAAFYPTPYPLVPLCP